MLITALIGFALGWVGSIPVAGPISALVLTRGLEGRFRAGVFIAVGGALAEGVYAFLAFYGFSTFLTTYPIIKPLSNAAGAIVLAVLGITFVRKKEEPPASKAPERDSDLGSFFLGASICAMNPALIATWAAVTTTLYASDAIQVTGAHAGPFALGCAAGIASWFATLLAIVRRFRGRFTAATLTKTVRVIGVALIGLGAWFAYRFVTYFLAT
jgi:threonine/homoserine/homoserine lactone efflux protein